MQSNIFFASHNQHKWQELAALFAQHHHQLNLADPDYPPIAETGTTFIENALIKAKHGALYSQQACIAEDSGLCVPILNNEPGLHSAHYCGHTNSNDNINLLLDKLKPYRQQPIPAFFYCCVVYLQDHQDPLPHIAQGRVYGEILSKPQGKQGFGYDPIFYLPQLKLSMAELSTAQKNQHSARQAAVQQLFAHYSQ